MRLVMFRCALILFLAFVLPVHNSWAQCSGQVPGVVPQTFGARAMIHWDADGVGPNPEVLVAAGGMGIPAQQQVAQWTGSDWVPIGDAFNAPVLALGIFDGTLIAAGEFTRVGSQDAPRIAQWTGASWIPIGAGFNGPVNALTVFQGELVAAGLFNQTGDVVAKQIAAWNGVQWRPLATSGANGVIYCLGNYAGELIAGGDFRTMEGVVVNKITAFDGANWKALGAGVGTGQVTVYALSEYGGKLIAGGRSVGAAGVLAWNGQAWSTIGTGFGATARALLVFEGKLVVGGQIWMLNGSPDDANCVAAWNGAAWSPVGTGERSLGDDSGPNSGPVCLSSLNGRLLASGGFQSPFVDLISQWTGVEWLPLTDVLRGSVSVISSYDGRFVVGGNFLRIGDQRTNHVMSWDGAGWQGFGQGLRSAATGITKYDGKLIVSGGTPRELPEDAGNISAWDGNAWSSVGNFDAGNAYRFAEYGGELVAAGTISPSATIDAKGLAAWNGTAWHGLGLGIGVALPNTIRDMCVFDNRLIVAGSFNIAGGIPVNNMAAWDGSTWAHAGGGASGPVNSMVIWNGMLVIGGEFTFAGDTPVVNVAAWSGVGTNWTPMNQNLPVLQLVVYQGDLLARVQGQTLMKKWTGADWVDFPFDPTGIVEVMGGEIAAWRTSTRATIAAHALPRYVSGKPMLPTQPRDPIAYCGAPAEMYVIVDNVGANTPEYVWRRDEIPLSDGPTGTGSVLAGVETPTLRIENLGPADAGSYDVVVTNSCGTVTSLATMVTPNCCPADLDGDGVVDDADFAAFAIAYDILACAAPEMAVDCPADFNRDGVVDDADFQVFIVAYDEMGCE